MRVISPPPPVSPGRFFWTAVLFGKELVGRFLVDLSLDSCIHAIRMFFEWRREDNSCMQCRIPLQLKCRMAPVVSWV